MIASSRPSRSLPLGWILIPLVLIISTGGFLHLNRHAFERHGMDAVNTIKCIEKNGVDLELTNPTTERTVKACHDPNKPKVWFILIVCSITGACITAFVFKEGRSKERDEVRAHFHRKGYR